VADLRHIESEIESLRQSHYAGGDEVNQAQGQLYESSAEVGRLEGEIRYLNETRQKAQSRLVVLDDQSKQWLSRLEEAKTEELQLNDTQAEHAERVERLKAEADSLAQMLDSLQENQTQAQLKSQDQNKIVIDLQQQIQVLAAEQRGIQDQLNQTLARVQRLNGDLLQIKTPDASRLEQAQAQLSLALSQAEEAKAALEELQASLPQLETDRQNAQANLNAETAKESDLSAKIEALKTLQTSVLDSGRLKPWLQKHGLDGLQALWSQLQVESGWETAVESALKERIGSYLVGRLESVQSLDKDPPPTKVVFHEIPKQVSEHQHSKLPRLIDRINCFDSSLKALLSQWLSGAYTAENLSQAFVARSQFNLAENENIYTAQGHVVGSSTVLFYAADHEQAGVLERNQAIENFEKQLKAQHLMREQAQQELFRSESAYKKSIEGLEQARQNTLLTQKRAHDAQVESIAIAQLFDQTRQRGEQISSDLNESQTHQAHLESRLRELETRFESLDMQLGDQQERAQLYTEILEQASNALLNQQNETREREKELQQQAFVLSSYHSRRAELQRTQSSAAEQLSSIANEKVQLQEELETIQEHKALEALQEALTIKAQREQVLASKRSLYDDLTSKLRASDERRLQVERTLEPLRQRMSDLQLKEQAARLSLEQFEKHLQDAQADLSAVELSIQEGGVQLQGLSSEIDRLGREIAALGAVNLAALDELTLAQERKTFLDAQTLDLTQAMNTLEAAIKKIDAETRDLLGHTFNSVNEHFGRMFPELFGGGNAKLVMTGEEILDSGVQVWAQPPGKKNQTIHLLSGGEKALTAIALVFAIFQLNPAPFCLLDEVDAPLDDANTERYCKLVKSMSKETQFLFISHNKIAMEMAEQLIGVTMQEQGVSRIVAVDMESAVSMVEA
jgi:chromosome segregation protein